MAKLNVETMLNLVRVRRTRRKRSRDWTARGSILALIAGLVPLVLVVAPLSKPDEARAQVVSNITVEPHDLATGDALSTFQYIVNVDNTRLPNDPDPAMRNGVAPTESNSPIVAEGDQTRATISLPEGRYLISIRSADHKMWGKHITLPQ